MQTPEHQSAEFIRVPIPVPLNLWAATTNQIFYNGLSDPLRAFRTLGTGDTLLPKAFATYLRSQEATSVHEIGSGNFHFAKKVVAGAPGLDYQTYDFSDSSYSVHGTSLPAEITFNHCAANQVREKITSGRTHIVGVELCDDLPNEYWSINQGEHLMSLWVDIAIDRRLDLPLTIDLSSQEAEVQPMVQGQRMATRSVVLPPINAEALCELIATVRWNELNQHNPSFLKALLYGQVHQFFPGKLNEILDQSWSSLPADFRPTGEKILRVYEEHLKTIPEFGQVIHLPTAAIALLWRMKDLPDSCIHFFDYGYVSPETTASCPFMNFQGQISTPVNFGMLKVAAEIMGYQVELMKDREFIQQQTGEDTLILARVRDLLPNEINQADQIKLLLMLFGDAVKELSPDAEVSEWTIMGARVRRADVDRVAQELGRPYRYQDGSYYFCARTPEQK